MFQFDSRVLLHQCRCERRRWTVRCNRTRMTFLRTSTPLALVLTTLFAASVLAEACTPGEGTHEGASAPSVSTEPNVEAARSAVKSGAVLVDVRSRAEFASGHARGALNVPVDEIGAKAPSLWPKDTSLVVVCASGHRASNAAKTLRALGYTTITNGGSHESFAQE